MKDGTKRRCLEAHRPVGLVQLRLDLAVCTLVFPRLTTSACMLRQPLAGTMQDSLVKRVADA